jgi:hypothetical protein
MMSVLLTVGAIAVVQILPEGRVGFYPKAASTIATMRAIEEATKGFMAANRRRPCPADGQYGIDAANFGKEAANPGTCTGGTPAAPFGPDAGTGFIIGGVVPTKTLNLPDEYAFDGWGRRITYAVDKRATSRSYCAYLQHLHSAGAVDIRDGAGATAANSMYAYVSHGPNGHGAFPMQGSSVANRLNTGLADADSLNNASVDASFSSTFDNVFVRKEKAGGFDDVLYFADYLKNSCCLGSSCVVPVFRFDGEVNGSGINRDVAFGDINHDGYKDLIIGASTANAKGSVYVIYGSPSGWPSQININNPAFLDGTTGFRLDAPGAWRMGAAVASADINGDGIDDIITGSNYADPGGVGNYSAFTFVVYGGPTRKNGAAWAATQTLDTNFLNGGGTAVNGFRLDGPEGGAQISQNLAIGDVNGDGRPDIIMSGNTADPGGLADAGSVWVVYGGPTRKNGAAWATSQLINDTFMDGGGTALNGFRLNGELAGGQFAREIGSGDINHDGFDDLILMASGTVYYGPFTGSASHFLIYGKATGFAATQTVTTAFLNGGLTGTRFDCERTGCGAGAVAAADINHDGFEDVILAANNYPVAPWGSNGAFFVVWGKATPWGASQTLDQTYLNGGGAAVNGFRMLNAAPLGNEHLGSALATGDLNNDGFTDILIISESADQNGLNNSGSLYVIYGKAAGWSGTQNLTPTYLQGGGTSVNGFRIDGEAASDVICAGGLATGDSNGDGRLDIACLSHTRPNSTNFGSTYLIYGRTPTNWNTTQILSDLLQ